MTVGDALKKHKISKEQWELFLKIAQADVRPPERKKHQRKDSYDKDVASWIRTTPGWAYIGGMRDSLWAWVNGDREAYNALEEQLTDAAKPRMEADKG